MSSCLPPPAAGAAVAVPLTPEEVTAYEVAGKNLTPLALAYLRARNADPMSSFGDFAAVSDVVDEAEKAWAGGDKCCDDAGRSNSSEASNEQAKT